MLTNKKSGAIRWHIAGLTVGWILFCGCAPSGPDALLSGERAIREGRFDLAIDQLQAAVRLLPKNAQAWNHLGLAYHGARQPAQALKSYRLALSLDYKLAAAHYNLGCLHLEQNDPVAAIEQLTSYTFLQPHSIDGLLRLGEAQLRARRLDAAEKTFRAVLDLQVKNPEALNGLGIVQLQRRRPQDAFNHFNVALVQNPNYSPALLNLAVVSQQNLYNRPLALQKYRQYLALQPRPANWEAVAAVATQLDLELNPAPAPATHIGPLPAARTNLAAAATNAPPRPTNPFSPGTIAVAPRTNLIASNPIKPPSSTGTTSAPANVIKPSNVESVKAPVAVTNKTPEIEVTRLPDELVIRPPQEISFTPPAAPPRDRETGVVNAASLPVTRVDPREERRGLISRLNPFAGKTKSSPTNLSALPAYDSAPTERPVPAAASVAPAPPPPPPPPPIARYAYLSPAKPAAGNRSEAEKYFSEGIRAQQAGRRGAAVAAYEKATRLDPAYFEAYYNQGLAVYEMGNWQPCLAAYEFALAIQPDALDARYNFALALKQANYPQDAANELIRILKSAPEEVRAHLSLANLYAQQLRQPKLAREHYSRVLELDPRHPKAAEIRYWLAATP